MVDLLEILEIICPSIIVDRVNKILLSHGCYDVGSLECWCWARELAVGLEVEGRALGRGGLAVLTSLRSSGTGALVIPVEGNIE